MPPPDLPNSDADALGRNCNFEIAFKTIDLLSQDTLPASFTTGDTVAVETPASLATSLIVHDRIFISVDVLVRFIVITLRKRPNPWLRFALHSMASRYVTLCPLNLKEVAPQFPASVLFDALTMGC